MQKFDVIVIGGGVIGGTLLKELTKFRLQVCLLEKENDVCMGQSKANSGIVHAGFDAVPGTLKAKFNVLGNQMMENYTKELGVKYENNGSRVVAFSEEEMQTLLSLKARGEENGVLDMEIIGQEQLRAIEPNIFCWIEKAEISFRTRFSSYPRKLVRVFSLRKRRIIISCLDLRRRKWINLPPIRRR